MRDGQPIPTVLTSGHKKSQSHLVLCLKQDRDFYVSNNLHLTTLSNSREHQSSVGGLFQDAYIDTVHHLVTSTYLSRCVSVCIGLT